MGDFFAGCVLGKCYLKKGSDNAKLETIVYTIIEVTLLAITIALSIWLMKPATSSIIIGLKNWTSLYIPMALAWIWIFTNCRGLLSKALSNPALIALGNISPQAFLIHYVVVRIANAYMSLHGIAFTPVITGALFAGEFIVTVILSQWYKNGPARPVPGPWL